MPSNQPSNHHPLFGVAHTVVDELRMTVPPPETVPPPDDQTKMLTVELAETGIENAGTIQAAKNTTKSSMLIVFLKIRAFLFFINKFTS